MKKTLFASIALVAALSSCTYNSVEDLQPAACDTVEVSYSNFIEPLIQESCAYAGCHAGSFPQAQLDLTTYASVRNIAENGKLTDRINRAVGDPFLMPTTGKLPPCPIEKIEAWVAAGAPQN